MPFEMWGMDVIGQINPPTSKGHLFILAITDYFLKWVEVIPLKEVKMSDIIKFIKHHVIYRFGAYLDRLFTITYPNLSIKHSKKFCIKFKIQSVSSTTYYPATNGLAEAINSLAKALNKTIEKLLKKLVSKSQ